MLLPHDPLPVSVMKMVEDEIAPFLAELFNRGYVFWPLSSHI